ncbi:hypothetical protein AB0J52_38750, partial [Spirillospora sp. NPDC049652]
MRDTGTGGTSEIAEGAETAAGTTANAVAGASGSAVGTAGGAVGRAVGLHRVLEPAGVLPQAAHRLDADPA